MRVALITVSDPPRSPGAPPATPVIFAGQTLPRRQLDLALALGCERVVCLTPVGLNSELVALTQVAEAAGAAFYTIRRPQALLGWAGASDQVLVFAEHLLPLSRGAQMSLNAGNVVLVVDAASGIEAGFERIDLNHAWAGALAMPGRLVQRLAELPDDVEPAAALLRIALQARISEIRLADSDWGDGQWTLVPNADVAALHEASWYARHALRQNRWKPFDLLAERLAARFGPALMRRGTVSTTCFALVAALVCMGIAGAWFGWIAAGFVTVAAASFAAAGANALVRVERAGQPLDHGSRLDGPAAWLIDAGIIIVAALGLAVDQTNTAGFLAQTFAPLVLMIAVRLIARTGQARWPALPTDRSLLAMILAAAHFAGYLQTTIDLLSLVILVGILLRGRSRITPN